MAIYMAVAFVIAVLSGLGVGGGGLFTVYLSVFTDTPQLSAQGLNLLFFLFSSGASVVVQLFKRRIAFGAVGIMVAGGIVGALVGTFTANILPEGILRKIFGVILVAGGIVSLKGGTYDKKSSTDNVDIPQEAAENGKEKRG